MYAEIVKQARIGLLLLIILSILTGILYPYLTTLIAQQFFSWAANGSLIEQDGKIIGSTLIGQSFTDPTYFWGRPSATTPFPYNAEYSAGSNFAPDNPIYISILTSRIEQLHQADKQNQNLIPVNLVTASASGLDPDISPEAAFYQVSRIAKARHISEDEVTNIIIQSTQNRLFTVLGEPHLNVLQMNLALSSMPSLSKVRSHNER